MPGPFLYQNQCAAFIELVFPLAVYQSLVDRRHSLVYMTIAAGMFATVIAAVSRAGVARLAAELLMVILLVAWRRGLMPALSLRKAVMRMAALSVVLAAVVGWQVTLEKFREPEPYRVRRELLLSSLAMVADHPWAGFGLDTWPVVYPAYARFDNGLVANHAHDDWAEVQQAGLASATERPILFCPELKRAHEYLEGRGASPGPIQDGGGTQFFEVRDLEGNVIEICKEP